jgi:HEAT repeat protein
MNRRTSTLPALVILSLLPLVAGTPSEAAEKVSYASLVKKLFSPDSATAVEAAEALGERGERKAVPHLLRVLSKCKSRPLALAAVQALGKIGDRKAVPGLVDLLAATEDEGLRKEACTVLLALDTKLALKIFARKLGLEKSRAARAVLGGAFGYIRDPLIVPVLLRVAVTDDFLVVRQQALRALAHHRNHPDVEKFLMKSLGSGPKKTRGYAAWALGELGVESAVPLLVKSVANPGSGILREAALALGELSAPSAVGPLRAMWRRNPTDGVIRSALAHALGATRDERAVPVLISGLGDSDWLVRDICSRALADVRAPKAAEGVMILARSEAASPGPSIWRALGLLGDTRAFEILKKKFPRLEGRARTECIIAAGRISHPGRVAFLGEVARSKSADDRVLAARVAGSNGLRPLSQTVVGLLSDPSLDVRMEAVKSLGMLGDLAFLSEISALAEKEKDNDSLVALCLQILGKIIENNPEALDKPEVTEAVESLVKHLKKDSLLVRAAAAWGLEKCKKPRAVEALLEALEKASSGYIRRTIFLSLRVLCREDLPDDAAAWKAWWAENKKGFGTEKHSRKKDVSLPAFAVYLDKLRQRGLDLLFVFDVTGSMGSELTVAQKKMDEILRLLARLVPSLRVGFVAYEDVVTMNQKLTYDQKAVIEKIAPLSAFGGGDWNEGVCPALRAAIADQTWREGARKVIVLIGDASPHSPARASMIATLAHKRMGIDVCCVAAHTTDLNQLPSFVEMAVYGGGAIVPLQNEKRLFDYFIIYALGPRWKTETEMILGGD